MSVLTAAELHAVKDNVLIRKGDELIEISDDEDEDEDEDEGTVPYEPVEYDEMTDLFGACVMCTQSTRSSGEHVAAGPSQ